MPRLIGTARAMGASLFGDAIGAWQAESWGLIWQCIPDDSREGVASFTEKRQMVFKGA